MGGGCSLRCVGGRRTKDSKVLGSETATPAIVVVAVAVVVAIVVVMVVTGKRAESTNAGPTATEVDTGGRCKGARRQRRAKSGTARRVGE